MPGSEPKPTRLQKERFLKTTRCVYRMDLTLEFTTAVTLAEGREAARKILDGLNPEIAGFKASPLLDEAALKCAELKRLIRLQIERADPASGGDEDDQ